MPWIEAAKKRLHRNVLALVNKLARIAWAVLNMERDVKVVKTNERNDNGAARH